MPRRRPGQRRPLEVVAGDRPAAPPRPAPGRTPGSPARSRGRWRRSGRRGPRSSTGAGRPASLTRPNVGFSPTTPHRPEGMRIEPPPSAPIASGTRPAATAAAEPADDPPVACPGFQGLRTNPVIGFMPGHPDAHLVHVGLAAQERARGPQRGRPRRRPRGRRLAGNTRAPPPVAVGRPGPARP